MSRTLFKKTNKQSFIHTSVIANILKSNKMISWPKLSNIKTHIVTTFLQLSIEITDVCLQLCVCQHTFHSVVFIASFASTSPNGWLDWLDLTCRRLKRFCCSVIFRTHNRAKENDSARKKILTKLYNYSSIFTAVSSSQFRFLRKFGKTK